MYTIMMVDDEDIVHEQFEEIFCDEKVQGFELKYHAYSGNDGLNQYKKYGPDIVITDVKMPQSTGIEMVERIKSINPNAICVVLSSYEDFSYARKAIELDVKYYILKHEMKLDLIRNKLSEPKCLLDKQQNEKQKIDSNIFYEIMIGKINACEIIKSKVFSKINFTKGVILQLFHSYGSKELILEKLEKIADKTRFYSIVHSDNLRTIVFCYDKGENTDRIFINKIQVDFAFISTLNHMAFIVLSDMFYSLVDLSSQYRLVEKLNERLFFFNENCIINSNTFSTDINALKEIKDSIKHLEVSLLKTTFNEKIILFNSYIDFFQKSGDLKLFNNLNSKICIAYHSI